jgi:hypothetical protein
VRIARFGVKIGIHNNLKLSADPFSEIPDHGQLAVVGEP